MRTQLTKQLPRSSSKGNFFGSEGFRVRLRRLSEYGSVAYLVERPTRETQAEQYSDNALCVKQLVNCSCPLRQTRPNTRDVASWIAKTEERGITVSQLQEVHGIIEQSCSTWIESFEASSPNYGKALVAKEVNLYQTVKNVIKPRTEPHKCSYVELVAQGPEVRQVVLLCSYAMCHQSRNQCITFGPSQQ